jgi:hypothetical protein
VVFTHYVGRGSGVLGSDHNISYQAEGNEPMTRSLTNEAGHPDVHASPAGASKARARVDAGMAFSGRPTTVRFSTDLQRRLAVAAEITGMSVSELMREGAEHVVAKYVGADDAAVAATIRAATEAKAERMRELYGISDE